MAFFRFPLSRHRVQCQDTAPVVHLLKGFLPEKGDGPPRNSGIVHSGRVPCLQHEKLNPGTEICRASLHIMATGIKTVREGGRRFNRQSKNRLPTYN